jgi:hypothetical protein
MNNTKKLIDNIKEYVDNSNFFNDYDLDIWITFIAIIITLFIVIYFYFKANIKLMKNSWEANKCNPFYMPFAKEITKSNDEFFNLKNAKQCSDKFLFSSLSTAFEPINAIMTGISYIFVLFSQLFIRFLMFLKSLFDFIKEIFDYFMNIIVNFINICLSFIKDLQDALYVAVQNAKRIFYMLETLFNGLLCLISIVPVAFFVSAVIPTVLVLVMAAILLIIGMGLMFFPWVGGPIVQTAIFIIFITGIILLIVSYIHGKTIDFAGAASSSCRIAERRAR